MTDPEFVEKKLAFIETCVRELRQLCQAERLRVALDAPTLHAGSPKV